MVFDERQQDCPPYFGPAEQQKIAAAVEWPHCHESNTLLEEVRMLRRLPAPKQLGSAEGAWPWADPPTLAQGPVVLTVMRMCCSGSCARRNLYSNGMTRHPVVGGFVMCPGEQ